MFKKEHLLFDPRRTTYQLYKGPIKKTSHLRPIYLKRHALEWKAMHSKHENRGWFHQVKNGFD